MPLPLIIVANAAVGRAWANAAIWGLGGLACGVMGLFGVLDLAGVPMLSPDMSQPARFGIDAGVVVTAFAAAGFLFKPIRKDVAAVLPIDPDNPVHALALVLTVILFGYQATAIAFTDVLALSLSQPALTIGDLFLDEIPFLILGVAGVGILLRRNLPQAAQRLGLVAPAWWHVALALAAAGAFFAFGQEMDALSHSLTPHIAQKVDATTQHVFGALGATGFGVAALAILPGLCEEVLFRGALQPRIGLLATAVLFTSIHTQYSLSFDTLSVFVIAIGLGLIRKYSNTTASAACHITYNLLVGIGVAGTLLDVAIAAEVALIAATAYAVWSQRRRSAPVNP